LDKASTRHCKSSGGKGSPSISQTSFIGTHSISLSTAALPKPTETLSRGRLNLGRHETPRKRGLAGERRSARRGLLKRSSEACARPRRGRKTELDDYPNHCNCQRRCRARCTSGVLWLWVGCVGLLVMEQALLYTSCLVSFSGHVADRKGSQRQRRVSRP